MNYYSVRHSVYMYTYMYNVQSSCCADTEAKIGDINQETEASGNTTPLERLGMSA